MKPSGHGPQRRLSQLARELLTEAMTGPQPNVEPASGKASQPAKGGNGKSAKGGNGESGKEGNGESGRIDLI